MSKSLPVLAALGALALAVPAWAQHPPAAAAPAPSSVNIQGDQQAWIRDPHMHAFYDLTVQSFAGGPAKVDEKAFTEQAFAIFRDFAVSMHVPPEHMVDHLKLIPGQVVQIAREDPEVLKSYANFVAAVFGPQ